jgi:hypothetical protein
VAQLYPWALASLFVAPYDSQGYGGGILTRVELNLSYCRRPADQFVLVSSYLFGPMTRFYPYPFFSDSCFVVLPVGHPLWREDLSVTYSAIVDWSGHWGPITIHYRLIWDCSPFVASYGSQGLRWRYSNPPPHGVDQTLREPQRYIRRAPTLYGRSVWLHVWFRSLNFSTRNCSIVAASYRFVFCLRSVSPW